MTISDERHHQLSLKLNTRWMILSWRGNELGQPFPKWVNSRSPLSIARTQLIARRIAMTGGDDHARIGNVLCDPRIGIDLGSERQHAHPTLGRNRESGGQIGRRRLRPRQRVGTHESFSRIDERSFHMNPRDDSRDLWELGRANWQVGRSWRPSHQPAP